LNVIADIQNRGLEEVRAIRAISEGIREINKQIAESNQKIADLTISIETHVRKSATSLDDLNSRGIKVKM